MRRSLRRPASRSRPRRAWRRPTVEAADAGDPASRCARTMYTAKNAAFANAKATPTRLTRELHVGEEVDAADGKRERERVPRRARPERAASAITGRNSIAATVPPAAAGRWRRRSRRSSRQTRAPALRRPFAHRRRRARGARHGRRHRARRGGTRDPEPRQLPAARPGRTAGQRTLARGSERSRSPRSTRAGALSQPPARALIGATRCPRSP